MLKDLFKEEKKNEEKPEDIRKKALIYLCIIIVGWALLSIGNNGENKETPKTDNNKQEEITVKKEDIYNKLDLIKTNYNIKVYKVIGEEESKLDIARDDDISIITGSALNESGYVQYKGKNYIVSGEEFAFDKNKKLKCDIPEYSYNIELLKNVVNYCNFIDNNNCEINVSYYLNEYNKIYNTTYKIDEDTKMTIKFEYNDKMVTSIVYNFLEVQRIIEKNDKNIEYYIYIESIGRSDFSDKVQYFEELSKKKN